MFYKITLEGHRILSHRVLKSLQIKYYLKSRLTKYFYISWTSFSTTKFIAHLKRAFQGLWRNFAGYVDYCNEDLSWTRKKGRANIQIKNLTKSAWIHCSERFIIDLFDNLLLIPSHLAQSDLFPLFKMPKLLSESNAKITKYIEAIEKDIETKDEANKLVPDCLFEEFKNLQEIEIQNKRFYYKPILSRYSHVWKRFDANETEEKKLILMYKISDIPLNTTILDMPNENKHCYVCGLITYIEDTTLDWLQCERCEQWVHYNNDLKCYTDNKTLRYWQSKGFKCVECVQTSINVENQSVWFIQSDDENVTPWVCLCLFDNNNNSSSLQMFFLELWFYL